ncbi:MAG: potassium-transporting ATPase subunit KdpC [Candidatus Binataceae bacterium]
MRLWTACRMTLVLTVLTGIIYPCVMVGLAQLLFPYQARGSLIAHNGQIVGSRLIGQNFSSPGYFHGRPSAAGDKGYDADSSGGSNLGPTNKTLISDVRERLARVMENNPGLTAKQVPIDLVTASGSGLDPEISPAAADIQIARVATTRGLPQTAVRKLVRENTRPRWAGIFGEPGVNVLDLNLALDALGPRAPAGRRTAARR